MQLRLADPSYTERLASFLRSVGQTTLVAGPGQLEVAVPDTESARDELEIYLRVWRVLYPEMEVHVGGAEEADEGPDA
jgi:hypothetical protein